MRLTFSILLAATSLWGQTQVRLYPQEKWIGTLQEYSVAICSASQSPLKVYGVQVWSAVQDMGVEPAGYSGIEAERQRLIRKSPVRIAGTVAMVLAAGFTICDQAGCWKIGNLENRQQWKVVIPVAGAVIGGVLLWTKQNPPQVDLPDSSKMLPAIFEIPATGCVEYFVYGRKR